MKKRSKVVAILPAYNAEKTVASVLHSLPKGVFDDIIVSDDCSVDKTWDCIANMRHIVSLKTPRNLGYGGNVKYCISKALEKNADIIIEIHPDGEYKMDGIVEHN
jgi:glycosyltransferase involved in cell wall biosynthesis